MAKEFQLPALGENIEQGVVVSILVKEANGATSRVVIH